MDALIYLQPLCLHPQMPVFLFRTMGALIYLHPLCLHPHMPVFLFRTMDSLIYLQPLWCHVKLLPSRRKFCVHHTTMHQFTVSLFDATYLGSVCLAVSCHLHFWQSDVRYLLRAIAVT